MPTATFNGTIKRINPTATVGKKDFTKRTFLLAEIKPEYPSVWELEFVKDACSKLDGYNVGDEVSCEVEITGREWQDKAFNTLKCFKITKTKAAAALRLHADDPAVVDDLPF